MNIFPNLKDPCNGIWVRELLAVWTHWYFRHSFRFFLRKGMKREEERHGSHFSPSPIHSMSISWLLFREKERFFSNLWTGSPILYPHFRFLIPLFSSSFRVYRSGRETRSDHHHSFPSFLSSSSSREVITNLGSFFKIHRGKSWMASFILLSPFMLSHTVI